MVSIYIVLQFLWWAWLLWRQDAELMALQKDMVRTGPYRPHGLWMVVGEGTVVLILVLGGLLFTYRSIRRELALARTQHNFLLAASHELRTPLAGAKLHLQTLSREGLPPEMRSMLMDRTMDDLQRLETLTERVLMATRLEEPGVPLRQGEHDLVDLSRAAITTAQQSYGAGHTIHLHAPARLHALVDPEAYRSVLDNLLENACKYAPPGTEVQVRLNEHDAMARLEVQDRGAGVPDADHERIFQRFVRRDAEETRTSKGMGLGLFIVRALVERMGGQVSIRNAAPHGAIFAATFPRS